MAVLAASVPRARRVRLLDEQAEPPGRGIRPGRARETSEARLLLASHRLRMHLALVPPRLPRAVTQLQHLDATHVIGGVDIVAAEVRRADERVVRPVVRDLPWVARVGDVQEPRALAVPRVRDGGAADVEVVRRAELRAGCVWPTDRARALLLVGRPRTDGLEPERLRRCRAPRLAVVAAVERGDVEVALLAATQLRLGEVLLGREQEVALPIGLRRVVADRPL